MSIELEVEGADIDVEEEEEEEEDNDDDDDDDDDEDVFDSLSPEKIPRMLPILLDLPRMLPLLLDLFLDEEEPFLPSCSVKTRSS